MIVGINNEQDAVTSGSEFRASENRREIRLKPLIGGLKTSAVSIFGCIRSDVGIVDRLAQSKVLSHLRIGNTVLVLARSWADIGEIDERIVATIVVVVCASVEALKAGIGHVFLVRPPGISLL